MKITRQRSFRTHPRGPSTSDHSLPAKLNASYRGAGRACATHSVSGGSSGIAPPQIADRVSEAPAKQSARGFYNSDIPVQLLRKLCALDEAGERTLELAVRKMGLSARAHDRLLKVSRTIADLDHAERVSAKHLAEAVQYRALDRNYWQ
jgi:magnesium chelatase family protein